MPSWLSLANKVAYAQPSCKNEPILGNGQQPHVPIDERAIYAFVWLALERTRVIASRFRSPVDGGPDRWSHRLEPMECHSVEADKRHNCCLAAKLNRQPRKRPCKYSHRALCPRR